MIIFVVIYACFFLSVSFGMIYEKIDERALTLNFTVFAIYMGLIWPVVLVALLLSLVEDDYDD
jgi:hypothetical protein